MLFLFICAAIDQKRVASILIVCIGVDLDFVRPEAYTDLGPSSMRRINAIRRSVLGSPSGPWAGEGP